MDRFVATYHFNVRRHLRVPIKAASPEEAARVARAEAEKLIDAEICRLMDRDDFGDTDVLDAHLSLDPVGDDPEPIIETEPLPLDEDSKNDAR